MRLNFRWPVPILVLIPGVMLTLFSAFCGVSISYASPGMSGVMGGGNFTLPDPKHPGKLLCNLQFVTGNAISDAGGFHGTMTQVWARLYENGESAAILTAPHAQGGSVNKSVVVTGTGGVTVKSLKQPGTILTADTVTWYAKLNKIVATGHVYYKDGKTGGVLTGPYMTADTKLKAISVGPGHATVSL